MALVNGKGTTGHFLYWGLFSDKGKPSRKGGTQSYLPGTERSR